MGFGSAPLGNYLRPLCEEDCDRTVSGGLGQPACAISTPRHCTVSACPEMRVGRLLAQRAARGFYRVIDEGRARAARRARRTT